MKIEDLEFLTVAQQQKGNRYEPERTKNYRSHA